MALKTTPNAKCMISKSKKGRLNRDDVGLSYIDPFLAKYVLGWMHVQTQLRLVLLR